MRITTATTAQARRQARWIVAQEPWLGLGYREAPLGRWLARLAGRGQVRIASESGQIVAVIVTQPEVLLGHFVALLAVTPAAAGRGVGRALVQDAGTRAAAGRGGKTAAKVRWLYTSTDAANRGAAAFYRKLGFVRVGRLPDLVREGRTEILWRLAIAEP
jgi:ribosomal protein S18 acetylase RimI-like enzyme